MVYISLCNHALVQLSNYGRIIKFKHHIRLEFVEVAENKHPLSEYWLQVFFSNFNMANTFLVVDEWWYWSHQVLTHWIYIGHEWQLTNINWSKSKLNTRRCLDKTSSVIASISTNYLHWSYFYQSILTSLTICDLSAHSTNSRVPIKLQQWQRT